MCVKPVELTFFSFSKNPITLNCLFILVLYKRKIWKYYEKKFRFAMKKYHLILLGALLLNLGPVLADCTKEEDQNTRNTIKWFIRNITFTTFLSLNQNSLKYI